MLIATYMRARKHELSHMWEGLADHEVLEAPINKLQLSLKRSPLLQKALEELYKELAAKGLKFRPKTWLSDEWFSPEGLAGFAIPFYLAHPRLTSLEKKFTGFAEGASPRELMKLLRHECGHAIDTAYRLRLRRKRQQLFGPSTKTPYRNYYTFKKEDPNFVVNLGDGYAQSHPDEDFAETFAVWLARSPNWKNKYRGQACLKKLEYMNELMQEIAAIKPLVSGRQEDSPVKSIRVSLGSYYQKRLRYVAKMQKIPQTKDLVGWR